jgi:exopolysaccharide production protein ExoQ
MGRLIATIVCLIVIRELFRLTREPDVRPSKALWLPTYWLFIAVSRNLSEWLHLSGTGGSQGNLEGSPLDRAVLSLVLLLAVVVLLDRSRRTGILLKSNFPILLYFSYCFISVIWSDFPDVAFKRCFRASGDLVMVLIVLTESDWEASLRRLLRRVGFAVVPLSILFSRYYPEYGRGFSHAGNPYWTGVTVEKNALGVLSMIFGLAFLYYYLQIYQEKKSPRRRRALIAYGTLVAMALYLLRGANSATALASFFLAGGPMVLTFLYRFARKPAFVNIMVFTTLGVSTSALFLNIGSGMVEEMGRNATLTGRTFIWEHCLSLVQNPILGVGFESFWLGPRYEKLAELIGMRLNQAHNGYIEVYLNLGWVGIALLTLVLITVYGRIVTAVYRMTPVASLRLAYFIATIAQNFTEASFKMMHPVWIAFLFAAMVVPEALALKQSSSPGIKHVDDIAGAKPDAAKVYVKSKFEETFSRRAYHDDIQRTRR